MLRLFRWLAHRPLWLLHALGTVLGWLTYWASPTYRRRFDAHVRQAGIAAAQARPAIAAAGRMVAELPFLWLRPNDVRIGPRLDWHGRELLHAALSSGRGAVILTPHMGCFEVTAQAIAQDFAPEFGPLTVLFRPARKALLRQLTDEARARPGLVTAPATLGGVRQMIRALRRGEAVGLLPDQVPPEGMGVWAPFFGKPAYTMTLAARLVQQTGAVPLLIWGERLAHGAGFAVRVSALDEAPPNDAPAPGNDGPLPSPSPPSGDRARAERAPARSRVAGEGHPACQPGGRARAERAPARSRVAGEGHSAFKPNGGQVEASAWGGSQAESAALINGAMERLILQCPQQYLWGYHRYKQPRSAGTG